MTCPFALQSRCGATQLNRRVENLLKYVGSKASIIKDIKPIIESFNGKFYIEPFVGGANSFCEINHPKRIGFDSNEYVIALLKKLRDGWIPSYISKETYIAIKANPNNFPDYLVGWAGINCSYSGKWFGGFAGITNTSIGTKRDYISEAIKNCLKQAPKLHGTKLFHKQYQELDNPDDCIIYCDPPYANTLQYKDKFDSGLFYKWGVKKKRKQIPSWYLNIPHLNNGNASGKNLLGLAYLQMALLAVEKHLLKNFFW